MSEFVQVGQKKDFPENQAIRIEVNGCSICIVNEKGSLYAFDDHCTHAEASLSGGDIEEGQVTCPLHGARFSIKTGEPLTLPAVKPVTIHEVKVEGENVFVKLKDL